MGDSAVFAGRNVVQLLDAWRSSCQPRIPLLVLQSIIVTYSPWDIVTTCIAACLCSRYFIRSSWVWLTAAFPSRLHVLQARRGVLSPPVCDMFMLCVLVKIGAGVVRLSSSTV